MFLWRESVAVKESVGLGGCCRMFTSYCLIVDVIFRETSFLFVPTAKVLQEFVDREAQYEEDAKNDKR